MISYSRELNDEMLIIIFHNNNLIFAQFAQVCTEKPKPQGFTVKSPSSFSFQFFLA